MGIIYVSFNFYSPADSEVEINPNVQNYFTDSNEACGTAIYSVAKVLQSKFDSVQTFSLNVPEN
jgi:hypothetical protein